MHHDHRRHFAGGLGRAYPVAAHCAVVLGRGVGDVVGNDVRVGEFNLLGQGVVGAQGGEQRRRGQPAKGEQCGTVEKLAAVKLAVGVAVVELQQFGGKVFGGETSHRCCPRLAVPVNVDQDHSLRPWAAAASCPVSTRTNTESPIAVSTSPAYTSQTTRLLRPTSPSTRARKVSVTPRGVGLMNLIPRWPVTQSIRGRLPGSRCSAR